MEPVSTLEAAKHIYDSLSERLNLADKELTPGFMLISIAVLNAGLCIAEAINAHTNAIDKIDASNHLRSNII